MKLVTWPKILKNYDQIIHVKKVRTGKHCRIRNIIHLITIYLSHIMLSAGCYDEINIVSRIMVWCGDKQCDGIKQYKYEQYRETFKVTWDP